MGLAVLTPAAMRAAEQAWFAAGNGSFALMERAAHAVASAALNRAGGAPVLVMCGPGNNGGDGWLAASLLRESGADVRVVAVAPPSDLHGDAARAAARWGDDWTQRIDAGVAAAHGAVIDALFGIGLSRPPAGAAADAIAAMNASGAPIIAVDVPSGVDAATGATPGAVVRATETIVFHALKPAHVLHPGRALCGRIHLADIGLPPAATAIQVVEPADWAPAVPSPGPGSHKYTRGGLAVWSGPELATGASRLAARAALRAGAGAVWLAGDADALRVHAAHVTAVMLRPADAQGWADLLADPKVSAALVGPGAGSPARAIAEAALRSGKPVVLDADAITAFAGDADALSALVRDHVRTVVLTPHAGELARLLPALAPLPPIERAIRAAEATGATVLLKGATSVVATPGGQARLSLDAPAWLATIGTGDVLAGLVGRFLAQGMRELAASAANGLHAECGRRAGPWLTAEDLVPQIARVLADLGAARRG